MANGVGDCYDRLAGSFHLIFEDWEASMSRQARALGPLIERECGRERGARILDCACGIGTQSLGLAGRGHRVTGCDLSMAAVERARREASQRGLECRFHVANMLDLSGIPEADFDAVIAIDNALPHLQTDEELAQASAEIRKKLRPGGTFLASIRDYDRLIRERPVVQGPVLRDELARIVAGAGFPDVRWLLPEESGFYQPLLVAHAPR